MLTGTSIDNTWIDCYAFIALLNKKVTTPFNRCISYGKHSARARVGKENLDSITSCV